MNLRHAFSLTNIALVAVFAGLIAASTLWAGIPLIKGVPVTLQTFAVLLAGAVLGPWRGAMSVIVYVILGSAGMPIFAGHKGGPQVWDGPAGDFLVGFVVAAFVTGWIVRRLHRKTMLSLAGIVGACTIGTLIVLNAIGYAWWALRVGSSPSDTLVIAVKYLPGDIINLFLASVVAYAVHRAYPQLLADPPVIEAAGDESTDVARATGASA